MCDQQSLRSACKYAQSDQSLSKALCYSLEYFMSVKLLTEQHLEFLSLKGGCTCSSESTLVKYQIAGNLMSRLILFLLLSWVAAYFALAGKMFRAGEGISEPLVVTLSEPFLYPNF